MSSAEIPTEQWSMHPGAVQRHKRGLTAKQQQALAKHPPITRQAIFESPELTRRAFYADSRCLIFHAEVRDALGWLKAAGLEVDCIVTSPPFYGQRDYGVAGQIGLEGTPYEFVSKLVEVFRDTREVLKTTGSGVDPV